jgi:membrane fusion protein (multidrug efflux system)
MQTRNGFVWMILLAASAPLLAGCNEPNAASAATPVVPEVSVTTVEAKPRAVLRELPGRIAPTRVADVRPRVSGIIVERRFEQGSVVKAGDVLYRIDPRPFEVELQAAEAALAKTSAAFEQTSLQANRVSTLVHQRVVSQAEHENANARMLQAKADVASSEADVARAKLNLEYATIRAPISGVIGAALVSEGALMVQNDTHSLATIQQLDSVYADFTQPISELNQLRRSLESGDIEQIAPDVAAVSLVLDDGTLYPLKGKLLFSDARVDSYTGQVTLRGEFKNNKRELLPGMYVRVLIEQGVDKDALAVPQQAIQRNGNGESEVFVVKADNHVAVQAVRTGSQQNGQWLINEGLKSGDRVIVEGFQKFTAGDKVVPRAWTEVGTAAGETAGDPTATTQLRQ